MNVCNNCDFNDTSSEIRYVCLCDDDDYDDDDDGQRYAMICHELFRKLHSITCIAACVI